MNRRLGFFSNPRALDVVLAAVVLVSSAATVVRGADGTSVAGRTYAIFDVLAVQRNNGSRGRPLVIDTASGADVLATGDLQPDIGLGPRLFVGRRIDADHGFEAGYVGLYDMAFSRTLVSPGGLAMAGPLGDGPVFPFREADSVLASYTSSINSAEFNAFVSRGDADVFARGVWTEGWGIDWLQGIRYVGLAEQARLDFTCCTDTAPPGLTSVYDVATSNNLVGWQVGGRGRRAWDAWAIEGWSKVGLFANFQTGNQAAIVDPVGTGFTVRGPQFDRGTTTAMVADLNLSVVRRLGDTWSIRAGYNVLWIGGVALAPNQWDFSTATAAGSNLDTSGWVFLHGANLGLETCW